MISDFMGLAPRDGNDDDIEGEMRREKVLNFALTVPWEAFPLHTTAEPAERDRGWEDESVGGVLNICVLYSVIVYKIPPDRHLTYQYSI